MTSYTAWMTDATSGSEGVYRFDAADDLFAQTPMRIVRTFFEQVDRDLFPCRHIDYEINAVLKHGDHGVVTAMGALLNGHGPGIPFTLTLFQE